MPKRPRSTSVSSSTSPRRSLVSDSNTPSAPFPSSPAAKLLHISPSPSAEPQSIIECHLPPHSKTLTFTSYTAYEEHYASDHVNRCLECSRNFPTERYLELHIAECHDFLRQLKEERGEKTYGCYVDGCDKMCSTPYKRRLHLIDKHFFPRNYDFFVIKDGLDGRNSLLRPTAHPGGGNQRFARSDTKGRFHGQSRPNEGVNESKSNEGVIAGVMEDVESKPRTSPQQGLGRQTTSPAPSADGRSEAHEHVEANAKCVNANESMKVDEFVKVDTRVEADESVKVEEPAKVDEPVKVDRPVKAEVEELATSLKALRFIPTSVKRARDRARGGLTKR